MLLPSQQLNENFNLLDKDIKNGSLSKIKKDFEQIKKFSAHRDYGYISGKIMWRLLASIRKNSLEVAWASVYNREKLKKIIEEWALDYPKLKHMSECAQKAGIKDAARRLADGIEKTVIRR